MVVVLPLAGLAFVADERRSVYLRALTNDANPFKAAMDAARGTDNFFFGGNFRPIGRFWEMLVHGFVFEAGEATAVAPHIVLGAVRITLVALVALGATAMVRALARSAGVRPDITLVGLYPLALGAVLVANGTSGALAQFPHTLIGSVALIFGVAVTISRDRDMQPRRLRWHSCAAMAATGVLAATFYDLAYLTPIVAAVFLAARCFAAGTAPRQALSLAATKRWVAHAAGFAAVFVPVRVAIAVQCSDGGCYQGSDLSLSFDAVTTALPRLLTGFPAVGWDFNADLASAAGVDLGFAGLAANAFMALLVVGIVVLAATAAAPRAARRHPAPGTSATSGTSGTSHTSHNSHTSTAMAAAPPGGVATDEVAPGGVATDEVAPGGVATDEVAPGGVATDEVAPGGVATDEVAPGGVATDEVATDGVATDERPRSPGRLAGALLVLGGSMAVLSASVAGLSAWAQQRQPPIGQAWRETLLTQVAWSLVIAAALAALDLARRAAAAAPDLGAVAAPDLGAVAAPDLGAVAAPDLQAATHPILRGAVTAVLALAMSLTLLANWRFAEVNRRDPAGVVTSLVALSAVNIDDTPNGNAVRCALIETYTEATADQPAWTAGQAVGDNLNDLTLRTLGIPYCDPDRPLP
ncbi:hypothetical protein [Candidatus Poriferisodalis sp.]|uniref:hypothetical protein n=1 Tax=Candidatus Poriferisodalis sp. TaxID=3101277 RepID=UPI003B51C293